MGYLFTVPVVISSITGGLLYTINPDYPWIVVAVTCVIQIIAVIFYIKEPENAEI